MLPIPAIDLKDNKCVRLEQGLMDKATIFSDNPVEMAKKWVDAGCERLHIVDLDGAFAGKPVNAKSISDIVKSFPNIPVQIGGGIRDIKTAKYYIDLGVKYIIIGTQAVKQPEFIKELCDIYPNNIIVGIDAKDGMVATEGWAETSDVSAIDLAKKFENLGVCAIVYTDIARDGMMKGVNIKQTEELADAVNIPIIASGGVSNMKDVENLVNSKSNIFGAIIGRAIYDGVIDLKEACQFCKK